MLAYFIAESNIQPVVSTSDFEMSLLGVIKIREANSASEIKQKGKYKEEEEEAREEYGEAEEVDGEQTTNRK